MTRLVSFRAPSLPLAGEEFTRQYQDQFSSILRLYFNKLDDIVGAVTGTQGGQYINNPYGAFQSVVTQTAVPDTATVMTFDTVDFVNGVSVVSGSRLTVARAGIYNLQWSGQFQNTDTQDHDVSVWLRQDGVNPGIDIPGSAGLFAVPSKHGTTNGHTLVGWNYFVSLQSGEFVELWWSTVSADVTIRAYPAAVAPVRPSTASLIATMSFVSSLS